ncbi:MAG: Uncharacterized protein G01um101491_343 [Parcubacteria group bacterium Gr01-1014_91]|nr:MAG: Uncharacterized protein G01um101491_343 [Parcubacteria group bacterium Gr01-1014_91]
MLYIIGGAPRSGKTLLARRIVSEKNIPYFPLDALFGALANGAPEFGISYENSLTERPVKMWPISKHLLNFFFEEEKDYLLEGDSILPSQVDELLRAGKPIKCCFLGYTDLSADEKLSLVRKHHQGEVDWTKDISDEAMLGMLNEMIEFSKYLETECAKYKIAYFDVSRDFDAVRERVFSHLFNS